MSAKTQSPVDATLPHVRVSPPPFTNTFHDTDSMIELGPITPSTTTSTSPPTYEAATGVDANADPSPDFPTGPASFVPTLEYQIQTGGKRWLSFPFPTRPDPIPIFNVQASGDVGTPAYVSIRPLRSSGNSYLIKGDNFDSQPICATTYRFGPGKPPVIQLLQNGILPPAFASEEDKQAGSSSEAAREDSGPSFEVVSPSMVSRAQLMRTPFGTFGWRYAPRKERAAVDAHSLMVLDKVVTVAVAGGKSEEHRTPVAQLVRNDEFRSPGSTKTTAGNGGRLRIDLRDWADAKDEKEQLVQMIVSSCLCMLKKEVDRRRMHQMIIIAGGASGGP